MLPAIGGDSIYKLLALVYVFAITKLFIVIAPKPTIDVSGVAVWGVHRIEPVATLSIAPVVLNSLASKFFGKIVTALLRTAFPPNPKFDSSSHCIALVVAFIVLRYPPILLLLTICVL